MHRSRAVALLGAIGVIVALIVAAVVVVLLIEGAPLPERGDVTRIVDEPFLRSCPATTCESSTVLEINTAVVVLGAREGEFVEDSPVWIEVVSAEGPGFVHISLLETPEERRSALVEFSVALLAVLFLIGLYVVAFSARLAEWISRNGHRDSILFVTVLAAGLMCAVAAYFLVDLAEGTLLEFTSDALLNLGAGFVGAAVTFALFQVLVSHRRSETDLAVTKLPQVVYKLSRDIAKLDQAVNSLARGVESSAEVKSRRNALLRHIRRRSRSRGERC